MIKYEVIGQASSRLNRKSDGKNKCCDTISICTRDVALVALSETSVQAKFLTSKGTYPYHSNAGDPAPRVKYEGFGWEIIIIDPSCHLYRILGSCSWSHVTRYGSAMYYIRYYHPKAT